VASNMSVVETVDDVRGVLVKMKLGHPVSRAFTAAVIVGGVAFIAGLPKAAFRDNGSMRPYRRLSADPEATDAHFLLVPLVAATAVYLFT